MTLYRSLLFVPGNNERFIAKSRTAGADIVCLDLEDSVPRDQKDDARKIVRSALDVPFDSAVFVRTNSLASGMLESDLGSVSCGNLDGIVVPKVDDPGQVRKIRALAPEKEIMPSIESARGVVNAHEIASCEGVSALVFGIFDLLHDMNVEYDERSGYFARSKVPVDARAAGIPAIDSVWQDVRDDEGLGRDCYTGKGLGYSGKSLVHPGQIKVTHQVFAPSPEQVQWARDVCGAYDESSGSGRGATTVRGKMIDEVHYKQAKRLLDSL